MTKLDLFCLQMTEKQAISSNNLHVCSPFAASVSIAGIFQPLPDGVLRLRLLNDGQLLRSIYDKYDILYLINGAG